MLQKKQGTKVIKEYRKGVIWKAGEAAVENAFEKIDSHQRKL